jgi:hypothetical protein
MNRSNRILLARTPKQSSIDILIASATEDKFSGLKKDDVVYIRSLNKPTHQVKPIAWNSQQGHVVKASYMGHDNKGNLRLFCDTGLGTSAGQGAVSVPKEWVSLDYKLTASILLNPNVGDTGVVYRDPTSTDSEFAASDHEGQGTLLLAKVKEVKGQRIRIDAAAPDKSCSYKDAWIFATHLYKNSQDDTEGLLTAELDADMIDGYVMQHIATEIRSGREPQTYVDKIRTNIKNVAPKDVDEALARLDNDGIISIKGKNIYPSSDLMEVYASTLAQRTAMETAKKAMLDAKMAHAKNPNPINRKRLETAKRIYAKHLKKKAGSAGLVEKGPPKPKRTAQGIQVTSSLTSETIQDHRRQLTVLKRKYRQEPSKELLKRIATVKKKIDAYDAARVGDHQHQAFRYELEKRKREG